jgi:glutamate-ammonia-ligase adenylyltransferase
VALARFKRREYLRIMLRDVLGLATLAETTLELSDLADLLLARALRIADQKFVDSHGTPQASGPDGRQRPVELVILSLGKLGGQELNYSSDIDLMFLYAADGETSGGTSGAITNSEFFVRLAQSVLKLVTEATPEGAVFRVDLRLRPQGGEGDLAVSLPAALDYYRNRAREWELQMLLKARCSAGDHAAARAFLGEVQPLIYRRELHLPMLEAVLNARREITRSLVRAESRRLTPAAGPRRKALATSGELEGAAAWNVKLSPGGIRDIEFLTQCLQRLFGGSDSWLRTASTMVAMQRLHDKGHLSGRDFYRLANAYQFLRKVEHRLQLRDGLQRHTLPEPPAALDRLARRSGLESAGGRSAGEILLDTIRQHFEGVRKIYERLLSQRFTPETAPQSSSGASSDPSDLPLLDRLQEEYPGAAREFSRLSKGAGEDPSAGYARRGMQRYLASALHAPAVMAQLEEHSEWISTAASLFARSDLAVDLLCRHPQEIALAVTAAQSSPLAPLPAEGEHERALALPFEVTTAQLAADLRVRYRRAQLGVVAHCLTETTSTGRGASSQPFSAFTRLTALVESALVEALRIAAAEVLGPATVAMDQAPFAVLALGRLGTGEMSIGSDADLLFVADDSLPIEDRGAWRRVAERLVNIVSSHTRDGLVIPVDTRLRPHGTEGELLPAITALRQYFEKEAAAWEAVTFLKLRPIAGNGVLGAQVAAETNRIFASRFADPALLSRELAHIRARVEKEASVPRAKGEFKKFRGGYYDVEYIVGFLTLAHGVSPPDSAAPARGRGNVLEQITAIGRAGALAPDGLETLLSAALLYRSVDHAARLITGRPLRHVPEPALAGRIARLLAQWGLEFPGGTSGDPAAALRGAIENMRTRIRGLYSSVVLAASGEM